MKSSSLFPLLLSLLAVTPLLHAHTVWIEDTPEKQLIVRFGDPGEKNEPSPGPLDKVALFSTWTPGTDSQPAIFTSEKKSDYLLLAGASSANPTLGEAALPVRAPKEAGKAITRSFFNLRWLPAGSTEATVSLTLDLIPTADAGVFRLNLRGKPLADTKVAVHAPGEKETEIQSDTLGLVHFTATKPGLYVLTANYRENVGGFAGGKAYEVTSHYATLSWRKP